MKEIGLLTTILTVRSIFIQCVRGNQLSTKQYSRKSNTGLTELKGSDNFMRCICY